MENKFNEIQLSKIKGFDLSNYKPIIEKKLLLRNCVEPNEALHIFNMAFKEKQEVLIEIKQSLNQGEKIK